MSTAASSASYSYESEFEGNRSCCAPQEKYGQTKHPRLVLAVICLGLAAAACGFAYFVYGAQRGDGYGLSFGGLSVAIAVLFVIVFGAAFVRPESLCSLCGRACTSPA